MMLCGMRSHMGWMRFAAAALSGLGAATLLPPFNFTGLVWIVLVPLLLALWSLPEKRAGWWGFVLGWLAGMVSFAIQLRWLGEVSGLAAWLLPAYLACFWGAFGSFAATWANPRRKVTSDNVLGETLRSLGTAFCIASVWAGLEWLRGWLFTGFGWNGLGIAFHETLAMAQAADLLGVAGLSLLVVFFQAVLVQAGWRLVRDGGKRRPRWDFGIAAMVVAAVLCYGIIRMAMLGNGESIRLKVLLVQINIPQQAARQLWDALDVHLAYEQETIGALERLAEADTQAIEKTASNPDGGTIDLSWPDWVMWPETALTGRILSAADGTWGTWLENQETLSKVRETGPFHLIYGVNELEADKVGDQLVMKTNGRAWNSVAAMTEEGDLLTYRKRHLVIFGEYIPLVESIPLLKTIYEQQSGASYGGSFTPGESFEPLEIPTPGGTIGAIPTVCFEDTVPRLTRKFVRPGPQVIVNVTNDGWFKESPAAAQHFANARFRAIELRRPMLRCANNGVSAAVDEIGSTAHPDTGARQVLVDKSGSHFARGSLLVDLDVPVQPAFSLYAVIGDWGIIMLGITGFGLGWWRRK